MDYPTKEQADAVKLVDAVVDVAALACMYSNEALRMASRRLAINADLANDANERTFLLASVTFLKSQES